LFEIGLEQQFKDVLSFKLEKQPLCRRYLSLCNRPFWIW